jgi:uncharacterized membrane protein YdjX (TVP38/TMEM64 family)
MGSSTTGVRWKTIPLVILLLVLASYLLVEGLGLVDFDAVLQTLKGTHRLIAASVIFALLIADVLLPVPSTPLMILAGTVLGAIGGITLSIVGSMGATAVAYGIGRFATPWLLRRVVDEDELDAMREWGSRMGRWVFAVARGIPMMAETVGISAGISQVPFWLFFRYTFIGTVPICVVYGLAGSYADTVEQIVLIAAVGFLAAVAVSYALRRRLR